MRKHLGAIGGALTVIYLTIMVVLVWNRAGTLLTMPLNEVGDFLAGAFGPVAFLWLVLGFLQQGDELRQGTEALNLQATELRNSVEQQKVMAQVATDRAQAQLEQRERGLLANFAIRDTRDTIRLEGGRIATYLKLRNDGNLARNASIYFRPEFLSGDSEYIGDMAHGIEAEVTVVSDINDVPFGGEARIEYEDTDGNDRSEWFTYRYNGGSIDIEKVRK